MLALATWTLVLAAVLAAALLATLAMVSFGRASSRADEEADRLVAEHRQAQRAAADTGVVAAAATPPAEAVGVRRGDEDDDVELARSG
jgi:hypothetical protein